jgi:hypothetical protein
MAADAARMNPYLEAQPCQQISLPAPLGSATVAQQQAPGRRTDLLCTSTLCPSEREGGRERELSQLLITFVFAPKNEGR